MASSTEKRRRQRNLWWTRLGLSSPFFYLLVATKWWYGECYGSTCEFSLPRRGPLIYGWGCRKLISRWWCRRFVFVSSCLGWLNRCILDSHCLIDFSVSLGLGKCGSANTMCSSWKGFGLLSSNPSLILDNPYSKLACFWKCFCHWTTQAHCLHEFSCTVSQTKWDPSLFA